MRRIRIEPICHGNSHCFALQIAAGTPKDILASDIGSEVHVGSSMSGDGERRIDYHVFEIEVDPGALCVDWYVRVPS